MVTVREIRQKGGPRNCRYYSGPTIKLYVIAVDGRRYDSRLSKREAMKAAKAVAAGRPVSFEPCSLMLYGAKPQEVAA